MMEESLQASREIPNADLRKQVEDVLSKHVRTFIDRVRKIQRLVHMW